MCYSAMAWQSYKKFLREMELSIGIKEYIETFWDWDQGSPYKFPKAMLDMFSEASSPGAAEIQPLIARWRSNEATRLEQELFKQTRRRNDAERSLAAKVTKKAESDLRISTSKIDQLKGKLGDLRRTAHEARDERIFPGVMSSVVIAREGKRVLVPMRYQCRAAGKPALYDVKYPGTYNARRDNLEGFWKGQFGHTHALMIVDRFYENVECADGRNRVLEFVPRDGAPMYVACLYSHWTDPKGEAPDLWSFAAITDEPEPEVAAAGHDRTIINIKPEHADAWLNPEGDLARMHAIFDDKRHPYYEHREAA
jgi:putative SOS response-associated peptidase YedK